MGYRIESESLELSVNPIFLEHKSHQPLLCFVGLIHVTLYPCLASSGGLRMTEGIL